MTRFGNRRRWATRYANGWTVFDRSHGVLLVDVSEQQAASNLAASGVAWERRV